MTILYVLLVLLVTMSATTITSLKRPYSIVIHLTKMSLSPAIWPSDYEADVLTIWLKVRTASQVARSLPILTKYYTPPSLSERLWPHSHNK